MSEVLVLKCLLMGDDDHVKVGLDDKTCECGRYSAEELWQRVLKERAE